MPCFRILSLTIGRDARRSRGALCHRHSTGLAAACRLDSRHLHDKSAGLRQSESFYSSGTEAGQLARTLLVDQYFSTAGQQTSTGTAWTMRRIQSLGEPR